MDDPPDPYDDHPSMMGPAPGSSSAAGAAAGSGGGGGIGASSAAVAAVDSDLDQRQALLMGGQGEEGLEAAVKGSDGGGGGGDGVWGPAAAGGGGRAVSLAFPDPASRVFVFEINEVRYGTVRYGTAVTWSMLVFVSGVDRLCVLDTRCAREPSLCYICKVHNGSSAAVATFKTDRRTVDRGSMKRTWNPTREGGTAYCTSADADCNGLPPSGAPQKANAQERLLLG